MFHINFVSIFKDACQATLGLTVQHPVHILITERTVKEHANVSKTSVMCLQDAVV